MSSPCPAKVRAVFPAFVFRGSPGWAGIGRLLGSLPVPHLTRGCPEAAPRQLQLRATVGEPLPFSGRTLCFLHTKALTQACRGCAFFLRKIRVFFPSFYPHSRWVWGFQPPSWCHLLPKGQCDSGSLELHNQLYSQFVWGGFQGFGSLGSALIFAPLFINKVINPCSFRNHCPGFYRRTPTFVLKGKFWVYF